MSITSRNEEDLKGLFERFVDSAQSEQAVEDVRRGEQILRENPALEPDDELIAGIKAQIAAGLEHKKTSAFRKIAYEVTAAAAAVILLAGVSVKLFEKGRAGPKGLATASIIPAAIWESDDISTDDETLATLTAEVEQIEDEVLNLQLGVSDENSGSAVTELEMELIEITSDFWKG